MKLKELFTDPSKWTQGTDARNESGVKVKFDNPSAVCWCLSGGLYYCYPIKERPKIKAKIHEKLKTNFAIWNDSPARTFQEIKALVEELNI